MKGEQYFKDKIDWKFFNAILDKLTKYEDNSVNCSIEVIVYNPHNSGLYIIAYLQQGIHGQFMKHYITQNDINKYNKYGLNIGYNVHIYNQEISEKFREEFNSKKYGYIIKNNDESQFVSPYIKIENT